MKSILFAVLLLILSVNFSFSKDNIANPFFVEIRLMREVYRMNRGLLVYVSVINRSNKKVEIEVGKQLFHNFRFRVTTLKNIEVKKRKSYLLDLIRDSSKISETRKIILAPNERYGTVIDIGKRFRLNNPERYRISCKFYRTPYRSVYDEAFLSNSMRFSLKPPAVIVQAVDKWRDRNVKKLWNRLTPGETVDFVLNSRRAGRWTEYFRYMDLNKLINIFDIYKKRYDAIAIDKKGSVMRDFRDFLKTFPAKQIKSHFVKKVIVLKDEKTLNKTAEVECRIVYKKKRLIEHKTYFFSLYKEFDKWYIYKYYVVNR